MGSILHPLRNSFAAYFAVTDYVFYSQEMHKETKFRLVVDHLQKSLQAFKGVNLKFKNGA